MINLEILKKYWSLLFFAPYLIRSSVGSDTPDLMVMPILALHILFIYIFFEYLLRTREKRVVEFEPTSRYKYSLISRFSLLIGLPLSLSISFLFKGKADFTNSALFIILPVTILFGAVGFNEWRNRYNWFLRKKYFNE